MTSLWHHQFISIIAVILYGIVAIIIVQYQWHQIVYFPPAIEHPLATSTRLPGHLLENNQPSQEYATSCCPQSSTLHNLPVTTKLLNVAYNFWLLYYSHHTTLTSSTDNISILHATHNYNRGKQVCMWVHVCACVCFVCMCVLCVHVCAYMHCVSCVWSFVSSMPISMYWICTQLQYTTPIGIVWITYLTIKQLSIFIADCLHHIARCGSLCSINWSVISWWLMDLCDQIFHTMTTM